MAGRVIVVGSVNIDLVVAGARLPAPGETVLGGTFRRSHGGKGGNQAVAAARLGAEVMFVGAVGDDPFGDEARDALAGEGIDVSGLARLGGVPTGVALILVDVHGENLISVASGANGEVTPDAIREGLARLQLTAADIVLAVHELPTEAMLAALGAGRSAGARTICNPAPAEGLAAAALAAADVVTPNRGELRALTGSRRDPVDAARAFLAAGHPQGRDRAILVSLGPAGAILVPGRGDPIELAAPPVKAVDATGAGDTLNGALAAALAEGLSLAAAARRAVVAASLSVTRAGAREGMPTRVELEGALRS
jgi:ribokinase